MGSCSNNTQYDSLTFTMLTVPCPFPSIPKLLWVDPPRPSSYQSENRQENGFYVVLTLADLHHITHSTHCVVGAGNTYEKSAARFYLLFLLSFPHEHKNVSLTPKYACWEISNIYRSTETMYDI